MKMSSTLYWLHLLERCEVEEVVACSRNINEIAELVFISLLA